MKIAQRKIKCLSRIMLVAALFTQGILVAHACVMPADGALQALTVAESMPCHETGVSNANACLMHCTQSDQVNLDQQTVAAISVSENMLRVAMPSEQQLLLSLAHTPLPLNSGPPLAIRFCSFLI